MSTYTLKFHHIDTKKFSIGKIPHTATLEDVKRELAKTICVCANCHRQLLLIFIQFCL
jgi:hypothetical protein